MAPESASQLADEPITSFTGGKVFDRVFSEGMALVEESASYLDGPGREQSGSLPRDAGLTYAAWSMELTTRLMQAASWLVMQKAVRDGDMRREEALNPKYRLTRDNSPPLNADAQRSSGMPARFLDLVERSEALFGRICRLDQALYVDFPTKAQSPVNAQLEKLQSAAETGAFDPLKVWSQGK